MGKYVETGSPEFWKFVKRHREALESIVASYHPSNGRNYSKRITAPAAEAARQDIVAEVEREGPIDFKKVIDKRDTSQFLTILNATWFGVPESTDCWNIEGFAELCLICEEGIPDNLNGVETNGR